MKYLTYNPEQGYLLPPSVREVLGDDQVCFFVHRAVEFALAATAFNLTRLWRLKPALA